MYGRRDLGKNYKIKIDFTKNCQIRWFSINWNFYDLKKIYARPILIQSTIDISELANFSLNLKSKRVRISMQTTHLLSEQVLHMYLHFIRKLFLVLCVWKCGELTICVISKIFAFACRNKTPQKWGRIVLEILCVKKQKRKLEVLKAVLKAPP